MVEQKKSKLTGIHRNLVLRPHQDERLNQLIEKLGTNRNALIRLLAETLTADDVKALEKRKR